MSELPTGIVTFLFTDIEGSIQLLQEPAEACEPLRQQHQEIAARAHQ